MSPLRLFFKAHFSTFLLDTREEPLYRMVKHLGIVGAGAMGAGMAQIAALAGIDVALYDVNGTVLRQAIERIKTNLAREASIGNLSQESAAATLERIHPRTRLVELNSSEIVLEAAIEDLRMKKDLLRHVEADTKPTTILATTTSTLSITAVASATHHPEKVVGLHFLGPAQDVKLVEIVRGDHTSADTVQRCVEFSRQLGKPSVVVYDSPGFLVNRVIQPFFDEPLRIVGEKVADPEQVDRIARTIGGFAAGPFETMDNAGLDTTLDVREGLYNSFSGEPRFRPHPVLKLKVAAGATGRKSGRGFFEYPEKKG
ncbi:MAG TPA: 3-hydroxybutyryl-CoA dehydrogenase [Bacteroidetes bacterium]|nr:3-hydroxybutyryl-CoA dehydrogenase [Bacteroidota bacterium]